MEKMLNQLIAMNLLLDNFTDMLIKMKATNDFLDSLDAKVNKSPHQKHSKRKIVSVKGRTNISYTE